MYHMIVGVIAVAVFAAMTAFVWLGGERFTDAKLRAELVAVQQQEQQIGAALTLYSQDNIRSSVGEDKAALDALLQAGYLKDIPPGEWSVKDESRIWKSMEGLTAEACAKMNVLAGFAAVCPPCDSEAEKDLPVCQAQ
jgi:hypothetical protein